jgi:prepilin-type N-terminal cleavage/methylation domain-containing protein
MFARAAALRPRGCQRQGASQAQGRAGVTLLELMVVIAMLGLLLAIAAPAFIVPNARGTDDLHSVLAAARRAAVLRAEPVTLSIDDAGSWTLGRDGAPSEPAIAAGTLRDTPGRVTVRISPLGSCVPELISTAPAADWSASACGPGPSATVVRQ